MMKLLALGKAKVDARNADAANNNNNNNEQQPNVTPVRRSYSLVERLERAMLTRMSEDLRAYFAQVDIQLTAAASSSSSKLSASTLSYMASVRGELDALKTLCLDKLDRLTRENDYSDSDDDDDDDNSLKVCIVKYKSLLRRIQTEHADMAALARNEAKWRHSNAWYDQALANIGQLGDDEYLDHIDTSNNNNNNKSNNYYNIVDSRVLTCDQDRIDLGRLLADKRRDSPISMSRDSPLLLYRASRDGFSSVRFHSHCDRQPHTLTLIKTACDRLLGAYAGAAWTCAGEYTRDPLAFVFKLDKSSSSSSSSSLSATSTNRRVNDIYGGSACGPAFGKRLSAAAATVQLNDLFVANEADVNEHSYMFDEDSSATSAPFHFRPVEIEVFQLPPA